MLGSIGSQLGVYQLGSIPSFEVVEPTEPVEVLPDLVEVTAGLRFTVTGTANVRTTVAMTAGFCAVVHLQLVER